MRPMRRWLPLLLSVLLHGAAVGVVATRAKPQQNAPPPPVQVIELEVRTVEVEPELSPRPATPPAPAPKTRSKHAVTMPASRPERTAQTQTAAPAAGPLPPDAPQESPSLLPSEKALASLLPAPEPLTRGVTLFPSDLPDPELVKQVKAAEAKQFVQNFAESVLAESRVEGGIVAPYFYDLRRRLNVAVENPPPVMEPFGWKTLGKTGEQLWESYEAARHRYGATGVAYDAAPARKPGSDVPKVVEEAMERGANLGRSSGLKANEIFSAGARLRDFGNGQMGNELLAVVELKQSLGGGIESSLLLKASGNKVFDGWVMERAPVALENFPAPDGGVGVHPDGLRSVWAFKGKVTYKRSVGEVKLKEDWWYLLGALPTNLLTGNFDEVFGTVEYIDLRYPKYECHVSLLQVY